MLKVLRKRRQNLARHRLSNFWCISVMTNFHSTHVHSVPMPSVYMMQKMEIYLSLTFQKWIHFVKCQLLWNLLQSLYYYRLSLTALNLFLPPKKMAKFKVYQLGHNFTCTLTVYDFFAICSSLLPYENLPHCFQMYLLLFFSHWALSSILWKVLLHVPLHLPYQYAKIMAKVYHANQSPFCCLS